jgi:hypothetical protein
MPLLFVPFRSALDFACTGLIEGTGIDVGLLALLIGRRHATQDRSARPYRAKKAIAGWRLIGF